MEGQRTLGATAQTHQQEFAARSESRLLYDHMYNQLEASLDPGLLNGNEASVGDLEKAHLIRASGPAEIEDFARMTEFLSHFDEVGEAIAYSAIVSDPDLPSNRRPSHKDLAKEMGLHQDEQLLRNLQLFVELFNKDSLR